MGPQTSFRARQIKTGESYTAARVHVMRERAMLLGLPTGRVTTPIPEQRVEAIVLKVSARAVRVRILGEEGQVTLRSADVWKVVPGHLVSLAIKRRWTWRGDTYASGKIIEDPRINMERGDLDGARGLLMEVLGTDLRCLDAHAQPGSMVFDHYPHPPPPPAQAAPVTHPPPPRGSPLQLRTALLTGAFGAARLAHRLAKQASVSLAVGAVLSVVRGSGLSVR